MPNKRSAMRFGPSDSYGRRYGVEGRNAFLSAIAKVAPAVLDSLRDDVYPQFRKTMSLLPSSAGVIKALRQRQEDSGSNTSLEEQTRQLDATLLAWSKRFHLESRWEHNWVLQAALDTMYAWHRDKADGAAPRWQLYKGPKEKSAPPPPAFHMEVDGWNPTSESPREARHRLRVAFKQLLTEYMSSAKANARHLRHKKKLGLTNPVYFEWLVHYLVLQHELHEIAEIYAVPQSLRQSVEAAQILQAIHPLSVILGLKWITLGQRRSAMPANPFN